MNSWQNCTLGDVITLQRGFDLPKYQRQPGKVPIVSSSGICDFHTEAKVVAPGVVTGRYGTLGQVFYVEEDFFPLNTTLYVKDFKGNNPLFVSFLLRTIDFQSCSDKSSVPGVNRNDLHRIKISIPPIAEQKAIAQILGTLDDKIELNQQMNQTLEAMQWSIFDNWFYAASEGDNWRSLPLEECMDAIIDYRGKTPKKTQHGIPLITAKIVKRGKIAEPQEFINPLDYDAWMRRGIPRKGDVVMTTEAPLGEIAKLNGKKVALAQRLITLRGKQNFLDNTYLKFLMQSSFIQEQLQARATGSTVSGIKQSELRQVTLPVPMFAEQQQIMKPIQVMEEKIDANDEQSRSLTEMRDRLLPKLLSGELRVKDAEELIEDVM